MKGHRPPLGRRRFSWERLGRRTKTQSISPSGDLIVSTLTVLVVSYFWFRPIFWAVLGLLCFVAFCYGVVGVLALWEWLSQHSLSAQRNKNRQPKKAIGH